MCVGSQTLSQKSIKKRLCVHVYTCLWTSWWIKRSKWYHQGSLSLLPECHCFFQREHWSPSPVQNSNPPHSPSLILPWGVRFIAFLVPKNSARERSFLPQSLWEGFQWALLGHMPVPRPQLCSGRWDTIPTSLGHTPTSETQRMWEKAPPDNRGNNF